MTLIEKLIKAGYPKELIYHHGSDLYVYATSVAEKAINDWAKENGYNKFHFVEKFNDNVTGKPMFNVAFQYDPFLEEKVNEKS